MKKNGTALVILTASFLACGALFGVNGKAFRADASSYSTSSVPTKNINLNDTSETNIRSYYANLNSLSASEKQGTNLLKNLKPILKNGQKYLSYGSSATTAVWQAYEIVDRDWELSPASQISGYNANTNTISSYTYGSSVSNNQGTNPYIHALYVNRTAENGTRAWSDHSQTKYGFNQEHIWAKSCGFDDDDHAVGARGDLMHLWAGNGRVNGQYHSNYYYGYVDTTQSYGDAGDDYSYLRGNLKGVSKTFGGTKKVFEPQDSDKGDIARAIFYMAARYNYYSGSDSDGIDAGNPNLELVNNITSWSDSGYTSSTTKKGSMGILQDLLEWNRLDPPDQWEIHRNNLCYNNFTKNRNPFIDFPEWAEYIWGKSVDGSYNSTVTGSADPENNPINTFSGAQTVSLSLSETSLNLEPSGSATISATASNSQTYTVSWSSSNTNVATVSSSSTSTDSNVTITAAGVGSAVITASITVDDKVISKTCAVSVQEETVVEGDVTTTISKTDYTSGYAESGTSGTITKTISANSLTINYAGINTKGSATGSAYAYTMYITDNGYAYSHNCPTGYYPSNVTVNFSSTTGTSGKVGISYSTSELSSRNSSVTGSVSKSGSYSVSNSDPTKLYWNFSTTSGRVQVSSIVLTYSPASVPVTGVALDTNEASLDVGDTLALEPTISPSNATDQVVSWNSDKTNIATVTNGVVTAVAAGTAVITVTTHDGSFTDTCTINVTVPVTDVSVSPSSVSLTIGGTQQLTCTITPSNATDKDVTWESSNESIASVSSSGLVTANAVGSASITVTSSDGEHMATSLITVSSGGQSYENNYNWDLSTNSYSSASASSVTWTSDYASIISTKVSGTNANNYLGGDSNNRTSSRFYNNNALSISPASGYVLIRAVFVATSSSYATAFADSTWSNGSSSATGTSVTITPTNGNNAITANITGTCGFTSATVYYHSEAQQEITSISASVSKTFHVGETIVNSDITVKDNNNNILSGFAFANGGYVFTYADAASGGALTSKTFTNAITYSTFTCSLTVQVQRTAYSNPPVTDTRTLSTAENDFAGLPDSSSEATDAYITKGGITYLSTNSYKFNNYLSFKTGADPEEDGKYVSNSVLGNLTKFPGAIVNQIEYELEGNKKVNITPTIEYSNNREDENSWVPSYVGMHYFRIRFVGNFTGYINFSNITITINGANTAETISNYIMYEDTNNQCVSKFSVAEGYFEGLTATERNAFMTSNDYVIATARERFEAWAANQKKSIVEENDDYVIKSAPKIYGGLAVQEDSQIYLILTVLLSSVGLLGLGWFLYKRKKLLK